MSDETQNVLLDGVELQPGEEISEETLLELENGAEEGEEDDEDA